MKNSVDTRVALLACLAGLGVAVAYGGFVTETATELISTADLDGDGWQDIVVVDKASGTFRAGYQLVFDSFTWSDSRALGATNITGLATGRILDTNVDSIAATTPLLNRVNVLAASSPTSPAFPLPAYGVNLGSHSLLAIEIYGTTPETDLIVTSIMNASNTGGLDLIESSGSSFSPIEDHALFGLWERSNGVVYQGGNNGAVFLDRYNNLLLLFDFSNDPLSLIDEISLSGLSSPDYCPIHPVPGGYVHFFAWDSGNPLVYRFELEAGLFFSERTSIDFGSPVERIFTINADGADWLVVVFSSGSTAIYAYDGSSDPVFHQELPSLPVGSILAGAPQTGSDRFSMLVADDETGQIKTAEVFEFDEGSFVGKGASSLPPVVATRGRGNVMVFREEPFVNKSPQRLQTLNLGDWSDQVALVGSPLDIQAQYETDRGLPAGLGNLAVAVLGSAHPDAQYTLANQAGTTFSIFNLGMAIGNQGAEAFVSPDPGHYRSGIAVAFDSTLGTVLYRNANTGSWTTYSMPIPLFEDTTLIYFSQNGGERSPIYTAAYTFEEDPGSLDSDGDGVPDYVELANGLDPLESGSDSDGDGLQDLEELVAGTDPTKADSDGDGVSDLNELQAGTDPNDPGDTPSLPIDGKADRINLLSTFDLHLTLRPYDGTSNSSTVCQTGTALRAYSGSGWQYAYATAINHGTVGVADPSVKLENIPIPIDPRMLCVLTDQHFEIDTAFSNKTIGIEMAGIMVPPNMVPVEVEYEYGGSDYAAEASNWVVAAQMAYSSTTTANVVSGELGTDDVLAAMLVERKLVDELFSRGIYTNRAVTLFPARPVDSSLQTMLQAELLSLQSTTNLHNAFLPATVIAEVDTSLDFLSTALLRQLTEELYDICSERSDAALGDYPLPIGVLRDFLFNGTLHSNYAAQTTLTSSELTSAFNASTVLLASVSPRPVQTYTLEVREGSFSNSCPVLFTLGGTGKSLYDRGGRPYILPFSFNLGIGAKLRATAFTDVEWNRCPDTNPLEIIALSLIAVPTSSGTDADGNLLPDAFELNILGGGGSPSHLDSDGDGFSDLQEYLEGTDPSDFHHLPLVAVEDLSPPNILISTIPPNQVRLDIDWSVVYAESFIFTIVQTTNLSTTGFTEGFVLPQGVLSKNLDPSENAAEFYRVQMQLR